MTSLVERPLTGEFSAAVAKRVCLHRPLSCGQP